MDAECLRDDFIQKLSDKVELEMARLDQCAKDKWDDVSECLGLGGLDSTQLYQTMEHQVDVWRSMYVDHLRRWLKVYPAESILVIPSEALKTATTFKQVMGKFAALLDLPQAGPEVHPELITQASPGSTSGGVRENGRTYIGGISTRLKDRLNRVFCPKNQELAQLFLEKRLVRRIDDVPWLSTALKKEDCPYPPLITQST